MTTGEVERFGPAHGPIRVLPDDVVRANRRAWIAALRSGEYAQARRYLRVDETSSVPGAFVRSSESDVAYCCLGVAEELRGCVWQGNRVMAPAVVRVTVPGVDGEAVAVRRLGAVTSDGTTLSSYGRIWLGLVQANPQVVYRYPGTSDWQHVSLTHLNDDDARSFAEIADVLEDQADDWDGSFTHARDECARRNHTSATHTTSTTEDR